MQEHDESHAQAQSEPAHHDHHRHNHEVTVMVDNKPHRVESGNYVVSQFKKDVHVDASRELDEIIKGELIPLDDNAAITIKGGEKFVSHVRRGGSS
jgi:hypothetical protein